MDYFAEANRLYTLKDYKKAIDYYLKSAYENINIACSYYNAGVCFIKLKKFDKAINMISSAINIQKESKYYFNLGYCYAMKEHIDKALYNFNLAWSIDPNDKDCEKAVNLMISKIHSI